MGQISIDKGEFFVKLEAVQSTLSQEPSAPEEQTVLQKNRATLVSHLVSSMLQYCIMPRLFLTPEDAVYSAKFIHLLHSEATPGYSSLQVCRP